MVKSLFHLYFRSSHHLYFIFLSRVKINSINWPAPNIWVFIAQLVEHCSANAEAMGSNPVEALKFFSGLNLQLLKLRLQLRWSNLYFSFYLIIFTFSILDNDVRDSQNPLYRHPVITDSLRGPGRRPIRLISLKFCRLIRTAVN